MRNSNVQPNAAFELFAPNAFSNDVCIVTGGGTGIGFATATLLVQLGAKVMLLGRRDEVVREAAQKLDPTGTHVHYQSCDIREPEQIASAVQATQAAWGQQVDILVNNAGGQFPSPAESISSRGFEAVIRNNLLGTFNMTREVATRGMIEQGGGRIVNVIANIERGFPGMVHTGAARAGVENMTRTLAIEWVRHDVRVNAVAPGIIRTEGLNQYPDELLEMGRRATPMRRLGSPEEVAAAIVFLCSKSAAFITGTTLYIDGGARLWGETWPIPDGARDATSR